MADSSTLPTGEWITCKAIRIAPGTKIMGTLDVAIAESDLPAEALNPKRKTKRKKAKR